MVVKRVTKKKSSKKKPATGKSGSFNLDDILESVSAERIVYSDDDPISINIWGGSGTGKTTMWSTFPGEILALFCSGGLKNPGELKSIPKDNRDKITPVSITSYDQVFGILEKLKSGVGPIKTIVLDHLTSLADLIICDIMGIDEVKPQKEWGDMDQQDWGRVAGALKTTLKTMMDLPCNTVIVSQERVFEKKDKDSEMTVSRIGPAVTPAVASWLHSTFDYSIRTFVRKEEKIVDRKVAKKTVKKKVVTGNNEYCAYLPLTVESMTKFRTSQKFEPVMVSPTYDKIMKIINA